ncbi:MAG TPA: ricin-type beta-trefoil lectin domain protein [Streptosporangiaceae bacterium]
MGPRAARAWLGAVAAVLAAMVAAGVPAVASAAVGIPAAPAQTGPYPVSATGRPDLCWQAAGNGSPVTLERCDRVVQGQQWTLTGDGVLMNGDGYCLEAGTGDSLFIGFDGQCGGTTGGQQWALRGGQVRNRAGAGCAAPADSLTPGTAVVTRTCGRAWWGFGPATAPTAAPKRGTPQGAAGPATQPSTKAGAANTAAAGPAAGQGNGRQAVLMTAGLLVFGGLLVLMGRRPRRRARRVAEAGVTDGVLRRRAAQEVADPRPTEPFDVSSIF